MQPLNGTASFFQHKYNRDFTIFDATPYTVAQCKAALHTHRVEVFRYELHRLNPGVGWFFVSDITQKVKKCTLHYDGLGIEFMGSATFEIVDTNNEINWLTDKIRVFHMLQMPDSHYVVWEKGTYHVPSPKQALKAGASRVVETQDTLRVYMEDKITDWLKIPSAPVPPDTYDPGDPINWARHFVGYGYPGTGIDISPDTTLRIGDDPPPAPQRNRSKIFQVGTPKLDVINSLLLYCNYEILRADVDGSLISHPFVKPSLRPIEYTLIADGTSIIVRESGETEQDLWDAPNQWLRTVTRPDAPLLRSRLTLTDPLNPLSTTYRGRVVTDEASIDAPDQATLDTVVQALFEDGQRIIKTLKVKTPLMPWLHQDKIMVQWTSQHSWAGVSNGIYTIYKWDFPCVPGGQMDLTLQLVPFSPAVAIPPGNSPYIYGGYGYYVNGVFVQIPVSVQVADAGYGSDAASFAQKLICADAGIGTEGTSVATTLLQVNVSDSGTGTETWFGPPVVPTGVIIAWPSTNASIPAGFTRVTALDGRYAKSVPAATNPGTAGGAATHTHDYPQHTHTGAGHGHDSGTSTDNNSAAPTPNISAGSARAASHSHTMAATASTSNASGNNTAGNQTGTGSNNFPYFEVIFIKSNGTPTGIPNAAVLFWNTVTPPSGWRACDGASGAPDLRLRAMRGAATAGNGGGVGAGGETHTHTPFTHTHTGTGTHTHGMTSNNDIAGIDNTGGGTWTGAISPHNHSSGGALTSATTADLTSTAPTGPSSAGDSTPPWKKSLAIQNNTGGASLPSGIIAMWDGTLASIPGSWLVCDGTSGTPDLRDKFIVAANTTGEIGNVGGSSTHIHSTSGTHAHGLAAHSHTSGTFTWVASATDTNSKFSSDFFTGIGSHTHAQSNVTISTMTSPGNSGTTDPAIPANSATSLPLYTEVVYIQKS